MDLKDNSNYKYRYNTCIIDGLVGFLEFPDDRRWMFSLYVSRCVCVCENTIKFSKGKSPPKKSKGDGYVSLHPENLGGLFLEITD